MLAFDADAKLKLTIPLALEGEGYTVPYQLSVDSKSGDVRVTFLNRAVHRYTTEGKLDRQLPIKAVACVADPATGGAWVATDMEILRVNKAGEVTHRLKQPGLSRTAWLALD